MRRVRALQIRTRLTLWYVAVFTVTFAALALFLVVNLRATLEDNAEESLELTYNAVVRRLLDGSELTAILHETEIPGETGQPEVIGQILGSDGRVVETSGQPTVASPVVGPDRLARVASTGHWHGSARLPGRDHDDVVIVVRFDEGPRAGSFLVLAQTMRPVTTAVTRLMWLLLAAAPVALVVAAAGGWLVAGAALRPVDDLSRRAAAIDASHPHEPLPVPPAEDELARLARTLNGMLDRLQRALDAERRFTADASHELRTPLAVIEAELDVALRSPGTPPEAKDVLRSVRTETAGLGRIVGNLLLLARAEATGEVTLDRRRGDLLELAMAVATKFRPAAAARGVSLQVEGEPLSVEMDGDLIGQALANLIDNAITHTDEGGSVMVTVSDGRMAKVAVEDTGTGIPPEELPRIFDRFYRVDRSRDRRRGGSGLGLEITRRIVDAHGGEVGVVSEPGRGATFTITLPVGRGHRARTTGTAEARAVSPSG